MHRYMMTRKVKTRLESRFDQPLTCRACLKEIAVGEPVVRTTSKMQPPPLYHERCYEATLQ